MSDDSPTPSADGGEQLFEVIRRAAGSAGFGVVVTDLDHDPPRSSFVNDRAREILGYSADELNVDILRCVAPEALPALLERRAQRERGETPPEVFETIVLHPDGRRVPIEVALGQMVIAGRRTNVSFIFDLGPRRRAESALKESEDRFRTAVQNAPDGVAILRGVSIIYLNDRAARMLGLAAPEHAYGRPITDFMDAEDAPQAISRIDRLVQTGKPLPQPREYRSRSIDGRDLIVEISSIPIELDGKAAVLAFARDVTERKAIQARLARADRLTALGVLSAGVAHEINNPLAYVLLNLDFIERELLKLARDGASSDLVTRVREAQHGCQRVATIVRDLKTFARGDEGPHGPVKVASVLDSALNIAGNEIKERARLTRRYADVPPVNGNAARLEQVFLNVLLNAAQAIPEGNPMAHEITVELGVEGDAVRVDISDTGIGIGEHTLHRIFDPFFTTKPPGVGTGLGLPICQSIVRAHGGDIRVRSAPAKGSTFTVTVPAWQGSLAPADPPHISTPPPPPAVRGRVLVVDDEPAVGRTLSLVLQPDFEVKVVTSAQEALGELRAARTGVAYDAILCDLVMPGMTGGDLYDAVQRELPNLGTRFIFMSGGVSLSGAQQFLARVANRTFEKPFDVDLMRQALRELVNEARAVP